MPNKKIKFEARFNICFSFRLEPIVRRANFGPQGCEAQSEKTIEIRSYYFGCFVFDNIQEDNGSQLKNPNISGAIFTLSLSIRILNSQCVEGVGDGRVL